MIYHVFANRSNIGDWLSAKGIQKLLLPHPVTECLCDRPFLRETMQVLNQATADDLIIIGGGGLLMDYFMPFWKMFQPVSERIPFCLWGVGLCDLKQENSLPSIQFIQDILKNSKLVVFRDELTWSRFPEIPIPPPVPCPSVNVIDPVKEKGNGILHINNYSTAGAGTYKKMRETALAYATKTGRIFREINNRINSGSLEELKHAMTMYQKSDLVLTSALHGCIISAAMGLKVLAISGDRKIDAFMERAGLSDWVLDTGEVGQLNEKLDKHDEQSDVLHEIQAFRQQNAAVAEKIKGIIEKQLNICYF